MGKILIKANDKTPFILSTYLNSKNENLELEEIT